MIMRFGFVKNRYAASRAVCDARHLGAFFFFSFIPYPVLASRPSLSAIFRLVKRARDSRDVRKCCGSIKDRILSIRFTIG